MQSKQWQNIFCPLLQLKFNQHSLGVDLRIPHGWFYFFFWAHISKEDSYRWVHMRRDDINGTSAQRQHSAVWEGNGALNGLRCCGWCEEDNKVIMGRLRIDIQLGEGVRRNERLRGGTWRRRWVRDDLLSAMSLHHDSVCCGNILQPSGGVEPFHSASCLPVHSHVSAFSCRV